MFYKIKKKGTKSYVDGLYVYSTGPSLSTGGMYFTNNELHEFIANAMYAAAPHHKTNMLDDFEIISFKFVQQPRLFITIDGAVQLYERKKIIRKLKGL